MPVSLVCHGPHIVGTARIEAVVFFLERVDAAAFSKGGYPSSDDRSKGAVAVFLVERGVCIEHCGTCGSRRVRPRPAAAAALFPANRTPTLASLPGERNSSWWDRLEEGQVSHQQPVGSEGGRGL